MHNHINNLSLPLLPAHSYSSPMASNKKNTQNPQEQDEVAILIYPDSQNNELDPKPTVHSNQSPEISNFSPNPNKPPKHPPQDSPLTRRAPKGKSRFGEPSVPIDSQTFENMGGSPTAFDNSSSFTQYTPRGIDVSGRSTKEKDKGKDGPDDKEIYKRITSQLNARDRKRMTIKILVQLIIFLLILSCLILSLSVKRFKGKLFLSVEVWKWFVLVMVIFSGMLITRWFVHIIVFLIEWKFMLKKNVVYFTHGLQKDVVVFIWLAVVLGTWGLLVKPDAKKAHHTKNVVNFVTMTLTTLLVGSFLWLVKTTLIKILASSFHLNRFFDRIQEAVFHHYVLQTLSGSPAVESSRKITSQDSNGGQKSFSKGKSLRNGKKAVDWTKLNQMKKERVPSWTMKLLVDVVSNSGLSTMSGMLNESVVEGGVELDDNEITSEEVAIATAFRIFNNIIGDTDRTYIEVADLQRFMIWEEADLIYQFFEANEMGHVDMKTFSVWVVKVFKDRQALQHALNDNKTAVDELNKILIGILIIITIILWLLLTEIISTKLLLFFGSQLLVAGFIFGNTCKTIFEAIIFVFVMHPFDVSDRCLVDGTRMIVEEMNIFTTVFLKADNEKVYYPNSVLATKPISNYYRSPDQGDTFEFEIDYRTTFQTIAQLKEHIKLYLEKNPSYWHPTHNLVVKDIENINKIKMVLVFNHTMNFQDVPEKNRRRSELVLEMKNIFDTLQISYHLLPQEVLVNNELKNS